MNRSLIQFIAITATLTTPVFLFSSADRSLGLTVVMLLLISIAPFMATILSLWFDENKPEKQTFIQRLWLWRVDPFWLFMALLVPVGIWLISMAHFMFGDGLFSANPAILITFPLILIGSLASEAGWRGYVLPRLLVFLDPIPASLLLGLLWSACYVPFFWQDPFTLLLIITLGPILAIISSWLFFETGESIPSTALFYATFITFGLAISPVSSYALALATALAGLWALFLVMRCGGSLVNLPSTEAIDSEFSIYTAGSIELPDITNARITSRVTNN
jgi:membrane protease YdiL (CAAX protease family)